MPASNATDAEKARFKELKQANKQGYIDLILSIDGEIGFGGVEKLGAPVLTKFDHVYIGDSDASCHTMTNSECLTIKRSMRKLL